MTKPTPIEIMERLQALPEHLRAHHRRFIVEAVSDETKAPMIEFYRQEDLAAEAALMWAKTHGADGFYKPSQGWGGTSIGPSVFSFTKEAAADLDSRAWTKGGKHWITTPDHVAMYPSKRAGGLSIKTELDELPKFPNYALAIDQLGLITDLNTEKSSSGVGCSDGKLHYTIPCLIGDRYFISAVNHNYDIAQSAQRSLDYEEQGHPEWMPDLDYKGDPIAWRPPPGWVFLNQSEFDFIIAEARLDNERKRAARKEDAS